MSSSKSPKMMFVLPPSREGGHRFHPSHHPIVTATLAGVARENGAQVLVIDAATSGASISEVLQRIQRFDPDWIGMVSYEYRRELPLKHSQRFASRVKEILPSVPVGILGAPIGNLACRKLVESRQVDFVVFGDAEFVVRAFAVGDGLQGSGMLVNTEWGLTEEDPVEQMDWSIVGVPAWDLLKWEHYIPSAHRYRRTPVFPVMASRSCPFACDFCPQSLFQPSDRYSTRPVDDIISEVEYLQERFGAQFIEFYDPTFAVHREKALQLVQALRNVAQPIAWSCYSRADLLDRQLLEEMALAGCHSILFGVESGNEEVLRRTQKDLSLDSVKKMVTNCRELGIATIASFIIGLPLDTRETLQETIAFACKLNPTYAQFHPARAFFADDEWKELGTTKQDWKEMPSSINGMAYVPNDLTQEELQRVLLRAYLQFYGSPKKVFELLQDIRSLNDLRRYSTGIRQLGSYLRERT